MKFTLPILAVVVAAILVASQSLFTVHQTQFAIKFQLGEVVEVITDPGLHYKVPLVQNVKYFDQRNLTLEIQEPDRVTTAEKKPLLVEFVVLWRIDDVRKFYVSVQGDEEAARRRLTQTVRANLAEEFNKRSMHEAISTQRDQIMNTTRQKADSDAKSIGVEIVDVRLRRVELPPDVLGPVYARMESERRRVANELRSQGAAESEKIRADADRQREVILAEAFRQAQKVKGDGDARAAAIYSAAYGVNPEFFAFYRSLEAYKASFRNRGDVMVLDPSSDFFRYFRQSGGRPPASK
ncbi:MAG: protease modulator HflC [Burkholderiales bacterium]|nr:protease modulator HflC [Burkholderiales bacterium]MCE7877367.1 protease modulator HflC [Betaproteobacteria bacterium PRO3]